MGIYVQTENAYPSTLSRLNHARPLQWCHNGHDSVSNHLPHDCLLNHLFRRRLKKTSKLRVTGLCAGNSPGTGEFPAQMPSNADNVSISWRHHAHDKVNYLSNCSLGKKTAILRTMLWHYFPWTETIDINKVICKYVHFAMKLVNSLLLLERERRHF